MPTTRLSVANSYSGLNRALSRNTGYPELLLDSVAAGLLL
jgi:hypothetical protein